MKKQFKRKGFTANLKITDYISFTGFVEGACGAVGDRIAEMDSDFARMSKLHLCDSKTGAPMHAWANAEYFAEQNKLEELKKHLRCDLDVATEYVGLIKQHIHMQAQLEKVRRDVNPVVHSHSKKEAAVVSEKLFNLQQSVEAKWQEELEELMATIDDIPEKDTEHWVQDDECDGQQNALGEFLDCPADDVVCENDNTYSAEGGEYLIVTDEVAENLWEIELDNYIDECIIPELPDNMQNYFDIEAWKRDARQDGRAHSLNRYDGSENFQGAYYIYRIS